MRPNIFNIATKELSQDGFLTWLLQWADNSNNGYDQQLNETAKDFVKLLIGQPASYIVNKVEAGRQWENIDIRAEVNGEFLIVIEDKTNSSEHSDQLQRYKETAEAEYKGKDFKPVFIYLKTGNESTVTLKKVSEKGYSIIDRKKILEIFNQRQIKNEIFVEFKEYLVSIENQTNSFTRLDNITSNWYAAEGFYLYLQKNLNGSDWGYVANPTGGFLGFWYHDNKIETCCIYIQIENAFDYGIKLVVKVSEWEPSTELLYKLLEGMKPFAQKNGLSIEKPDRYRAGETSTLAIVENAFPVDNEGNLELEKFLKTLKALEKTIDEYYATGYKV